MHSRELPPINKDFIQSQGQRIIELEKEVLNLKFEIDRLTSQKNISNELIRSYQEIIEEYKEMLNVNEDA
jgi:hypothetical protein